MADTTRYVPEHRRQAYKGKNLFKGDELRRRREEQQIEIRKQKKDENLAKRRNLTTGAADTSMESDTDEDVSASDEKVFLSLFSVFDTLTRLYFSGKTNYQNLYKLSIQIMSTINFLRQCNFEN